MNEKQIQIYQKKTSIIIEQANNLKINTKTDMTLAVDQLSEIKTIANNIKEIKEKYTKPANEILKTARAMFNPLEEKFRDAERIIKAKMIEFDVKQQKEALKKTEKIVEQVESGKLDIMQAAEKMELIVPKKTYEGQEGIIQYRTIKKIVIVDINKIPRQYLTPDTVLIRKDLLEGKKISGVELREEKIIASA